MSSPISEVLESLLAATRLRPLSAAEVASRTRENPASDAAIEDQTHWLTRQASRALVEGAGRGWPGPVARQSDPRGGDGENSSRCVEVRDAPHDAAIVLEELLSTRVSQLLPGTVPANAVLTCLQLLGTSRHTDLDDVGRVWQSRVQPSAGGTHSLEPLLHVEAVDGLETGWYCQGGQLAGDVTQLRIPRERVLTAAVKDAVRTDEAPAATLFAVCDPRLVTGRYPTGSSLLWRDAGAFLMTAHLIAHAHGLSSTLAGICVEIGVEDEGPAAFAVGAVALGAHQGDAK